MAFGYRLLWIGRRARDPLLESAGDYATRLARYAPLERAMIRDSDKAGEGHALLEKLRAGDHIVCLDERGKTPTTVELSHCITGWMKNQRAVVFVIGGADGLHDDVKARARETISLSRFTLPHRLAQVVLLEQLYRAHTLLKGEKYHRA
ncbi:MAG: 23S rRNA (pseudouridine(1915)-N(3))-methyltransferase RlmH [Clostridia bacterium]|nr:23S rRNA (pseudouridine(1915)-N(3))-methyltransferase RlmH [Deltaproteobacteria bacterium]